MDPRDYGLRWVLWRDMRTGALMPTLEVERTDRAFLTIPKTITSALNGTSVTIRSMMYARKFMHEHSRAGYNLTAWCEYVLENTIKEDK